MIKKKGCTKTRCALSKRGQQTMGMPFNTIFALFLIVIFIGAAFMGIRFFMGFGRTADVGLFYDKFQKTVDDAWAGQSGSSEFKINLPDKIKKVCFANLSAEITANREEYDQIERFFVKEANTFLVPPGAAEGMEYKQIEHLDVAKITSEENPYCIDPEDGLVVKKDFYDKLVWVE